MEQLESVFIYMNQTMFVRKNILELHYFVLYNKVVQRYMKVEMNFRNLFDHWSQTNLKIQFKKLNIVGFTLLTYRVDPTEE